MDNVQLSKHALTSLWTYLLYSKDSIDSHYNSFRVYCRELAPGTVSLTADRAQGDDCKHDSHYSSVCWSVKVNVLLNNCKQNTTALLLVAGRTVPQDFC